MWQLTWMFGFLPSWFWTLLLIAGILMVLASWVLKFIPFVGTYRLPIQVAGVLSLVTSIWFLGAASNEEKWKARVAEAEQKVKVAEAQSKELNEQLRILNDKTTVVRDQKTQTIVKYIDSWITKEVTKTVEGPERIRVEKVIEYIERCPIPKELLEIHNQAAKGEEMKK